MVFTLVAAGSQSRVTSLSLISAVILILFASGSIGLPVPVPIGAPDLPINTPTSVVLRQGHSITEEAIRQEIDSDTLRLLSFAKPNRILSHLGIRGSLGEASLVLNRRPANGERQDLQSPFVFPNEEANNQSPPSESSKDTTIETGHPFGGVRATGQHHASVQEAGHQFASRQPTVQQFGAVQEGGQQFDSVEGGGQQPSSQFGSVQTTGQQIGSLQEAGQQLVPDQQSGHQFGSIQTTGQQIVSVQEAVHQFGAGQSPGHQLGSVRGTVSPFGTVQTTEHPLKTTELPLRTSPDKLLEELMTYGRGNKTAEEVEESYKLGYSVDEGTQKRFRYEEKTPEGLIVGEFGIHKGNGDGIIRGVRYTAEAGVHPKVLYEALVKFLSL